MCLQASCPLQPATVISGYVSGFCGPPRTCSSPWTWMSSAGRTQAHPQADPGLRVTLQRQEPSHGCDSLLPPASGSRACRQGRRVPPSSPWRCCWSLAQPLPLTGWAFVLCVRPVCQRRVRLPSARGPWKGEASSSRLARAPSPSLRPLCPVASFLVCGIQGRPGLPGAKGAAPSGKPCPAAAGCPHGQGAKGGPFLLLGGPSWQSCPG